MYNSDSKKFLNSLFYIYLGDFLISLEEISVARIDGEGERGGGDNEPGDNALLSIASWSIGGL